MTSSSQRIIASVDPMNFLLITDNPQYRGTQTHIDSLSMSYVALHSRRTSIEPILYCWGLSMSSVKGMYTYVQACTMKDISGIPPLSTDELVCGTAWHCLQRGAKWCIMVLNWSADRNNCEHSNFRLPHFHVDIYSFWIKVEYVSDSVDLTLLAATVCYGLKDDPNLLHFFIHFE